MRPIWLILASTACCAAAQPPQAPHVTAPAPRLAFGKDPRDKGNWVADGGKFLLSVNGSGATVQLHSQGRNESLHLRFLGAQANTPAIATEEQPARLNYLIGNDPQKWVTDAPTFGRLRYNSVYLSTDLIWYGNGGSLEYDLVLHPGADPDCIRLHLDGARKLALDHDSLRIQMRNGSLELKAPVVYQERNGVRASVASRYELLAGGDVAFRLGAYDTSRPLVIDPVLVYASYFGYGSSSVKVGTDAAGNVYLGSETEYVPVTADAQPGFTGPRRSLAISKFNGAGVLQYSTFVGGDTNDTLIGMAVGADGTVVLTGNTSASQFPFTETVPAGVTSSANANPFLLKLNAAGNAFDFVAKIQGTATAPLTTAVAVDANENIYVGAVGAIAATAGAYNASGSTTTVLKYSPSGALVYAAVLPVGTTLAGIVADDQGAAYIAGTMPSGLPSFPGNPPGVTRGAGPDDSYWFICKLTADGTQIAWASFLAAGGPAANNDSLNGIARDPLSGTIYLVGTTTATDVPTTAGALQTAVDPANTYSGLLASVSADGSQFPAITYLDGSGWAYQAEGIAVTSTGVVVAGPAFSGLALQSAIQPQVPLSQSGLVSSVDGGVTWASVSAPISYFGRALWIDPANSSILLELADDGIYRSTNGGVTGTRVFSDPSGFAVSPDGHTLYTSDANGLYASNDAGVTWNLITSNTGSLSFPSPFPAEAISINPANPLDIVIAGNSGGAAAQSLDGGVTFASAGATNQTSFQQNTFNSLTDAAGDILIPVGSGFIRSADRGKTWVATGGSLPQIMSLGQAPSNPAVVYASPSNCGVYRSADFGLTWTQMSAGPAMTGIAVSFTDPNTVFMTDMNGNVFESTDGGVTLTLTGSGPDVNDVVAIAIDPSNASHLDILNLASAGYSFVSKLNSSLTSLVWSTYYGSTQGTILSSAAAMAGSSDVWVAGFSQGNLPVTNSTQGNGAVLARISDSTPACSFTLNGSVQYVYLTGTLFASITAPSGCAWTATSDSNWITVKHGASGTGSGTISAQVAGNPTGSTRVGHLSAGGQTISITEPAAGCNFAVPSVVSAPEIGGSVKITVTTTAGCDWDVESPGTAVSVTAGGTGSGTGTVTVTVPSPAYSDPNADTIQIAGQTVTVQPTVAQISPGLRFIPVTPCRVADTRLANGAFGGPIVSGQQTRAFTVPSSACSIPSAALAYSVNLTVVPSGPLGYVTMWPTGQTQPVVSTLNSVDGRVKATAAIVGAGTNGAINVFATNDTHVVLDINGYFVPNNAVNSLAFYPLPPCRVADTRSSQLGSLGSPFLAGQQARDLPIGSSQCGIPATAQAYSMNFTAVPRVPLGYLTVWPSGQPQPLVSTLNSVGGQVVANGAIVPAGTNGNISVFASNDSDLVIDVNGYFAPPIAGGLSLYTITPCRVLDTRLNNGSPVSADVTVNMATPACGAPATAQAYVLNATVVPQGGLGYLTLWPDGTLIPLVSTLNATDGVVTSNMAIVPSTNGVIDAYPSNPTHLVVDLAGFFAQ